MMRNSIWILLALALTACDQGPANPTATTSDAAEPVAEPVLDTTPSSSYKEASAAAVVAIEAAAAKGHAWTTSDQLIIDAAEAAANGDEALAIRLADEARWHAELAVTQADREARTWHERVISE